jgi:hypothetical protein
VGVTYRSHASKRRERLLPPSRRSTRAAKKLMCEFLKKQGVAPNHLVTDHLKSYPGRSNPRGLWMDEKSFSRSPGTMSNREDQAQAKPSIGSYPHLRRGSATIVTRVCSDRKVAWRFVRSAPIIYPHCLARRERNLTASPG